MITARDHLNCLLNAEGEQIIINELDVDALSAAIKALELVGDFAHTGKESKILLHLKSLASALGQNKARIVCEPVGNVDTIWVDENDLLALRFAINKLEREGTCGWIPVKDRLPEAVGKECDKYLVYGRESVGKDYEDGEHEIFIGNFDYSAGEFGVWVGRWAANGGFDGDEFYRYPEVLAWQPLPEPYDPEEV